MDPEHHTLKHRLDTAFFQIIGMSPVIRKDLQKMWRVAKDKWTELDQELVVCRKHNKITPKYQKIKADVAERLETIDMYITFGLLT